MPLILPAAAAAALSADERERAGRFHFAADRLRYVFAHAVLRDVLSRYLSCPACEVRFARNRFGKPFVDATSGSRRPEFNLSHAGRMVLVGICGGGRIGIDVEEIRPMEDLLSIAESHYGPEEYAFLLAQPPGQLERAFFRCWTRKEAYVKALGKGLSIPLNSFDTLARPARSRFSDAGAGAPGTPSVAIAELDVPDGYAASVALEDGISCLSHFEWRTADFLEGQDSIRRLPLISH